MRDRQNCIDCGKLSPETDTNYTLISSQFGWRLTRQRLPDGTFAVEWRCPDCWREHKRHKTDDKPVSPGPASSAARPVARPSTTQTPATKLPGARTPSSPPRSPAGIQPSPAGSRDRVHTPLKPR